MSNLAALSVKSSSLKQELEQLFRANHKMLYQTAYSLLDNPADAEDVPQVIFLRLLRTGLPEDLQRNPRGYLYRAAVNQSLSVLRSRRRHPSTGDSDTAGITVPALHSDSVEENHRRLAEAMTQLAPEAAQILILRYMHNTSGAEIAKLLGISRGSAQLRLFRARARLRKLMENLLEKSK
jgi:RNA polymerase sigma-70 factor, ECF subfamily